MHGAGRRLADLFAGHFFSAVSDRRAWKSAQVSQYGRHGCGDHGFAHIRCFGSRTRHDVDGAYFS